ncbi:GH3 auxin-responsive promoter [Hallella multisaccharivorax DSM 17128]|uniref:GH3 auxin-responsive promoter n=2 Tax=Hallella multisaccharivorax TaxID=310514 RepID=F8N6P1_9BACT|nr:GH3 auxin-responsive promoter [Hallella multisaccharivorax DSM 17128]
MLLSYFWLKFAVHKRIVFAEMSLTKIAGKFFLPRQKELDRHYTEPEQLQRSVLSYLVSKGMDTEYGRAHAFENIKDYTGFVKNVPINTYEELKGDIDRMRHGEQNVLWPGLVKWYAKSSGTTNDKSKFIPISVAGLHNIHYKGGADVVALYLRNHPESRLFDGKSLILGGSHSPNYNVEGSLVGDLSAILIENINPIANLFRVPKKRTALLCDFELKRDRIAHECLYKNVTNISGVPSWMLSVLVRVLEVSGKKHVEDVWPNLEVFFHGGIAFTPYRKQYEEIITSQKMHYMEAYNASEGFFGIQDDPSDHAMLLMLDYGVYYEFIPLEEVDKPNATVIPLEGVETGKNYAMVISTSCGLWRYMIGDTVMFTSKKPYKFVITGRTKYFINAFGEELIQDNAEKGLAYACEQTGAQILEYTAAPVYMDENAKCRHQWLIEFSKDPDDLKKFADCLDSKLQEINSDYEAKRFHDVTLQHLEVVKAHPHLFEEWLKAKGKLGGQHKVPRLSNSRKNMDELLELNGSER